VSRSRRRSGRGVPGEEEPPTPVGDALAEIGAELGLADPSTLRAITTRWSDVVGAAIAQHARIRSLRGTVLTIAVESGAWATELRYLEHDVLARIESIVGPNVVTEVRVAVDPHSSRDDDT
jgi:predicted nucleic acid-binding Zn ribbon protein